MKTERKKQTVRLLKWIRRHGGLWYLICTPDEEHMNHDRMRSLVKQLDKEGFYELIFVLLMVHRNAPCMANVPEYLLLDRLIAHWKEDKDSFVQELEGLLA